MLAQRISIFLFFLVKEMLFLNIGSGSLPLSAILPANNEIIDFVSGLDDMQLPEAEARVFFEGLLKRNNCVCGEKLDNTKRNNIIKEMESFISSENASIISNIKNSINQNQKEISKNNLNEISIQTNEYKHDLDAYSDQIEYLYKSQLTEKDLILSEKIKDLEKKRGEKEIFLREISKKPYTTKDDENSESLVSLIEQKNKVEKKLAILSSTQSIEEKVQYLQKILSDVKNNSQIQISEEISEEGEKFSTGAMPSIIRATSPASKLTTCREGAATMP